MVNRRIVYSSEGGRVKQQPPAKAPPPSGFPDDGVVRISREKGNRGGKTVTVVRGLPERGDALEQRAAELKRLCGAGGTLRDGAIEIQGDHRERIAERLKGLGYTVKLAGG
ncbi:MAG TPA: stress response translation initiation inhibitor YciH [Dehalococcoidia bacterium]|nr:stress response translation initiation inhibitor YciH [Dehalococcoidia bacterium]